MSIVVHNLLKIKNKIINLTVNYDRVLDEVTLLVVSKTQSIDSILEIIKAGHQEFSENYVQEGVEKIRYFQKMGIKKLKWHFIGSLQSNKSKQVAKYFDWCHTIDRLCIAVNLNKYRPVEMNPLNVLIQINISNEKNKSGIYYEDLHKLASEIIKLPNLKLRGLMSILDQETSYERQFARAQKVSSIFRSFKDCYQNIDTLSLGMSNDMEAAIAAGSTMVRIGTAIFGKRKYLKDGET